MRVPRDRGYQRHRRLHAGRGARYRFPVRHGERDHHHGRPGLAGAAVRASDGRPLATVITSTVTVTNVADYLQAASSDSQRVALSFLPPISDAAPTPLALDGWRGVQPTSTLQP